MDAKDNGRSNPFTDTVCSLEWIASAMDAARRHTEQKRHAQGPEETAEETMSPCGDAG